VQQWERSTRRTLAGGRVDTSELPRGVNGRACCRWCSLEVPPGRRSFCSDFCVHEWRLRTDPGYLRDQVFARDRGLCAGCGLNTVREWNRVRRLRGEARLRALREWGMTARRRNSLWDADHIVPVAEGGGECDLANLRTLCLRCHAQATSALRERLRGQARRETETAPGPSNHGATR
jgi:5-methylcytosine-specific restriction endonuclease McrA